MVIGKDVVGQRGADREEDREYDIENRTGLGFDNFAQREQSEHVHPEVSDSEVTEHGGDEAPVFAGLKQWRPVEEVGVNRANVVCIKKGDRLGPFVHKENHHTDCDHHHGDGCVSQAGALPAIAHVNDLRGVLYLSRPGDLCGETFFLGVEEVGLEVLAGLVELTVVCDPDGPPVFPFVDTMIDVLRVQVVSKGFRLCGGFKFSNAAHGGD